MNFKVPLRPVFSEKIQEQREERGGGGKESKERVSQEKNNEIVGNKGGRGIK